MPEAVEIFVPCDVVNVNVVVGPYDHLSPLEELFLRAVHEGATGFYELSDIFGVGPRLTLDLIFDLWRRSYLVVDMARGTVQCTAEVSEVIRRGELEQLSGGETREETRDVMLDRLTGSVLPVRGPRGLPVPRAAVPDDLFDFGIETVSRSALIEALKRVIERRIGGGRPARVLAARLSAQHLQMTAERRWLPVHVEAAMDESETLVARVVDADMPATTRRLIGENLALIVEDRPDSAFVQYLMDHARRDGAPQTEDVADLLRRLETKVTEMPSVERGVREHHQLQLEELAAEIDAVARDAVAQEAELVAAAGREAHLEVVHDLVMSAKRQLVIVCPWIRYRALSAVVDDLQAALRRGVQVFLLWGIAPDSTLDQDVSNALLQLRLQHPTRFFFSSRSSVTHAKLLIQDDEQALVTSLNFLSSSRDDAFELGAVIRAPERATPCAAISTLLEYARGAYPEYIPAQSMFHLWEDFHEQTARQTSSAPSSRPAELRFTADLDRSLEDLDEQGVALWQLWWQTQVRHLGTLVAASPDTARIRKNGQHREALWRLIGEAQERLLISSDQLGPEVVDQRLLGLLDDRLRAGVKVVVLFNRLSKLAQTDERPLDDLLRLESQYGENLRVLREQPSHSKVIVSDDSALVSSFNFLSFEGYYEDGRRGGRRPQRSEIGVELRSESTTNGVAAAIASAFPKAAEVFPLTLGESERVAPSPAGWTGARRAADLLANLAHAEHRAHVARVVRQLLLEGDNDAWQVLEWLGESGAPRAIVRMAAATALSTTPTEEVQAARWRLWLAEEAWARQAYIEAALLRSSCADCTSSIVPRPELAMLAAAWGTPAGSNALATALSAVELGTAEIQALTMVAAVALLVYGSPDAAEFIEARKDEVDEVWRPLLNAAREFWGKYYQAVPLAEITTEIREHAEEAALGEGWDSLAARVSDVRSRTFAFGSGLRMRTYLFSDVGPMRELVDAIQGRDAAGVARWLGESGISDVDDFLDEATRTATGRDDQLLHSGTRASYVRLLEDVRGAALTVAKPAGTTETHEGSHVRLGAISVAELVTRDWPVLNSSVTRLPTPEGEVVRIALASLEPLGEWRPASH